MLTILIKAHLRDSGGRKFHSWPFQNWGRGLEHRRYRATFRRLNPARLRRGFSDKLNLYLWNLKETNYWQLRHPASFDGEIFAWPDW
jgi:hypothetical protein